MRPGQLTPENAAACRTEVPAPTGFNEAGAINPGKPPRHFSRFNEAGAINPGKLRYLYLFETKRQISGDFEQHPRFDELHVSNINFM